MHSPDYEEYIKSPAWAARKDAYYAKHEKRCSACGTTEGIHLHHHTYARLGSELDVDLVPLCDIHHRLVHFRHGQIGGPLTTVTFLVINQLRMTCPEFRTREKVRRKAAQDAAKARRQSAAASFVPRNRRGAKVDASGRIRSSVKWRDEVRDIKFR